MRHSHKNHIGSPCGLSAFRCDKHLLQSYLSAYQQKNRRFYAVLLASFAICPYKEKQTQPDFCCGMPQEKQSTNKNFASRTSITLVLMALFLAPTVFVVYRTR